MKYKTIWHSLFAIGCLLFTLLMIFSTNMQANLAVQANEPTSLKLYRWADDPSVQATRVTNASERLLSAIKNPEYMLQHWVELPTSPESKGHKIHFLTLREAILLALRYNPNIQNAELDRIMQRYQLRLAQNEFELQYALAGSAAIERSRYSGVGHAIVDSYIATPELRLKTKSGAEAALMMDNSVASIGNYNPLLNFSVKQPLLRGFGKAVNEAGLKNAIDTEWLNRLGMRQSVMDQITQVIVSYRALILSGNNLQNQKQQLKEAQQTYVMNDQRIRAGQLEPTANIQQSYQIESLKLMVEQARNDFTTNAQDLLQAIGLDPDMKLAVPSDVNLDNIVIPNEQVSVQQALAHNTQYQALKMLVRADERAYTIAKNQRLWQLDVSANVQTGTMTNVDRTSPGLKGIYNGHNIIESAGVMLTIPLRDITARNQLISAKVRLEKDRLNLIAAKRSLTTMIKNAITTIKSQAKRYELAKRQVALAEQSYVLEKKKKQAGISTALDVNNTQNQLLQAQMGLISAKISYLNQLSELERLLGMTLERWKIKLRAC